MQEDLGYNRMQDLKQIVESIKEEGSAAAQKLAEQLLLIIWEIFYTYKLGLNWKNKI